MRALLKTGETVDIDTSYLFNDQYNTFPGEGGSKNGRRIFDAQISRIYEDARVGMGKCRYCGAMIRKGEEEKHFSEREEQGCEGCFYWQNRLVSSERSDPITTKVENPDGTFTKKTVEVTTNTYMKQCTYHDGKTSCNHTECRAYGVEWFTPKNTFFMRFPEGFDLIKVDNLTSLGFEPNEAIDRAGNKANGIWSMYYERKLGSYEFSACVMYHEGKILGIDSFWIRNSRVQYHFRRKDGRWYEYDHTFGWKERKHLDRIPDDVIEKLIRIMEEVEEHASAS